MRHGIGGAEGRAASSRALFETARQAGRTALDEATGKRVLSAYGIAVPRSRFVAQAQDVASALGSLSTPFVIKVVSPDVIHKSDVGGVAVGLDSERAVLEAMDSMRERLRAADRRIDGFLVEEMAAPGTEVVIGTVQDPSFGPVLMFGLGGVFVEVMRDVAFRICPVDEMDAVEMIHEIKGAPLLFGARGGSAVDESALVRALLAIGGKGGLAMDLADELGELDVNPLIARADGVVAVDARVILKTGARP